MQGFKDSSTVLYYSFDYSDSMYIMLDDMYVTMSISTGLYPNLDSWTANKLQLHEQGRTFRMDVNQTFTRSP